MLRIKPRAFLNSRQVFCLLSHILSTKWNVYKTDLKWLRVPVDQGTLKSIGSLRGAISLLKPKARGRWKHTQWGGKQGRGRMNWPLMSLPLIRLSTQTRHIWRRQRAWEIWSTNSKGIWVWQFLFMIFNLENRNSICHIKTRKSKTWQNFLVW